MGNKKNRKLRRKFGTASRSRRNFLRQKRLIECKTGDIEIEEVNTDDNSIDNGNSESYFILGKYTLCNIIRAYNERTDNNGNNPTKNHRSGSDLLGIRVF